MKTHIAIVSDVLTTSQRIGGIRPANDAFFSVTTERSFKWHERMKEKIAQEKAKA